MSDNRLQNIGMITSHLHARMSEALKNKPTTDEVAGMLLPIAEFMDKAGYQPIEIASVYATAFALLFNDPE